MLLIEQLADDPFLVADEVLIDAAGRELCCLHSEGWSLVYRIDHAAKEMRVLEIEEI